MNSQFIKDELVKLTGVNDFEVELVPKYSKRYWARYFPWERKIRIFALDVNEKPLPENKIMREAIHEMTHHMQYYHTPGWFRMPGIMHDFDFKRRYKRYLLKYNSFYHSEEREVEAYAEGFA
jgi:hypothetical protein